MANFGCRHVRKLQVCSQCQKIGLHFAGIAPDDRPNISDVPLVLRSGKEYFHPRCVPFDRLAVLSRCELESIRLKDLSKRDIQLLLNHLKTRITPEDAWPCTGDQ